MKNEGALLAAGAAALAVVVAAGAVGARRQRERELSPVPTVENGAPRGLAAARGWLAATGHPHRVLGAGDPEPAPGESVLLIAPRAALEASEADALLAHVERGGRLVWCLGDAPQPALERRLGVERLDRPHDGATRDSPALAPHPLFDGLVLRTGGASLRVTSPAAHPVAGTRDLPVAAAVTLGAGEAIVLAGPEPLENFRLAAGENVSLLSRLASEGPIAFDERHLRPAIEPPAPSLRTLVALVAQALLAALALLFAVGRRLGDVRGPGDPADVRTAHDYLASLAGLYRRAGAERELVEEAWRRLRVELASRASIPASASVEEAAARLAPRGPEAVEALRRADAARSAGSLLGVSRAAASLDAAIRHGRTA